MKTEYYCGSLRHNGHIKNEYLDDTDFEFIVNEMFEYFKDNNYEVEDIEEDGSDAFEMIEYCIREIVEELACTDFGWKYGSWPQIAIDSIVESVAEEIRNKY